MKPLCKWCKHRKYHHRLYPLDGTLCKGKSPYGCICSEYEPVGNLEYLEELYNKRVDNIKKWCKNIIKTRVYRDYYVYVKFLLEDNNEGKGISERQRTCILGKIYLCLPSFRTSPFRKNLLWYEW